jgi:hypothetical protein
MSLETDIQELTKAVLALTYALNQARSDVGAAQPGEDYSSLKINKDGTVKAEVTKVKKPVAVAAPTSPEKPAKDATVTTTSSKPTTDTSLSSDPESVAVTYDDVKKLIIAISKESKDRAVAALQRFGVANGKQLTESTYPEVVAYLTKVLAGEVNLEESHA